MVRKFNVSLSILLLTSMIFNTVMISAQPTIQNLSNEESNIAAVFNDVRKRGDVSEDLNNSISGSGNVLAENDETSQYVEGEAIVLYDSTEINTATIASMDLGRDVEVAQTYDFEMSESWLKSGGSLRGGFTVAVIKSATYSTEELLDILNKRSDIVYAEPNFVVNSTDASVDTYAKYQWALDNRGQNGGTENLDINPELRPASVNDGKERVIAIVDTGVDYTHEDLAGAMWINPVQSEQLKGKYGYDFINDDDDPMDDLGHGTHCAGIMVAEENNGVGISGVVSDANVKLMALKVIDAIGSGDTESIIAAYNYIYMAQQLGINVVAINNSWGQTEKSDILDELIDVVGRKGAISVCAAGNERMDNDVNSVYPANSDSPYVISVAASNEDDELASFSNYGENTVDMAAPGTNILSTSNRYHFVPEIYDNSAELCSFIQDFSDGNLVQTISEENYEGATVGKNDIAYGITTNGGKADISVGFSSDEFWGDKEENARSLEWTLKGVEAGEMYYFYLPYIVAEDNDAMYSGVSVRIDGEPGSRGYNEMYRQEMYNASLLYVCDSKLCSTGMYDISSETYCGGAYADDANYWTNISAKIGKVAMGDTRAMAVMLFANVSGDYTIYMDNFAISKSGIEESSLGKYMYDNGTSMATPYVTGAVVTMSMAFPDATPEQIVERVLSSVRVNEQLKGKVKTGGVLDLSVVYKPTIPDVEETTTSDEIVEKETTTKSGEVVEKETTTKSGEVVEKETTTKSGEVVEKETTTKSGEIVEKETTTKSGEIVEKETTTKSGEIVEKETTTKSGGKVEKEKTTKLNKKQKIKVGIKVFVGKNVYKVLENSKKKRTVVFVALKNKKASEAKIPASIKINGLTYKVTKIASGAFKNCKKLKEVTIEKNVVSIGKNTFEGCEKIEVIKIKSKKIIDIKKNAFKNTSTKLIIKVPKELKDKYRIIFKKEGLKGKIK